MKGSLWLDCPEAISLAVLGLPYIPTGKGFAIGTHTCVPLVIIALGSIAWKSQSSES
jgi:hypothetical protein